MVDNMYESAAGEIKTETDEETLWCEFPQLNFPNFYTVNFHTVVCAQFCWHLKVVSYPFVSIQF